MIGANIKENQSKKKNHLEKKIIEKRQEQKTLVILSKCESHSSKHIYCLDTMQRDGQAKHKLKRARTHDKKGNK